MKKYHLVILSVLSGILFSIAWPYRGFPGLLFIAFVPLFFIEDFILKNKQDYSKFSLMVYAYPAFLVWNGLTTWWIWNASPIGGVTTVIVNAFLMTLTFNLYHISRRNLYRSRHAYFSLIFFWITFEYIHLNWDLNWPWLNLGNGFANYVKWIQWYEYTGAFGGTLWVLVVNILVYNTLRRIFNFSPGASSVKKDNIKFQIPNPRSKINILLRSSFSDLRSILLMGFALLTIFLPIILSLWIYNNYEEKKHPVSIIVTQPNVDPYTEQYTLSPLVMINKNLDPASALIDERTDFIVSPESAIQEKIWERNLQYSPTLARLKQFVAKHPQVGIVIGASTFKEFREGEEISSTARKFTDVDRYYDAYNTVFYIDTSEITQWSHKSKLTPGVEKMPYPRYFRFLEKFALDLGGTVGTLATDPDRVVFTRERDSLSFAAAICYESVFGEYYSRFVENGAQLMMVVTNDGWWGDTPGYRQHFTFSRLRAIETRRSIARSANTGISAFIDQRGNVFQQLGYWVPGVIKQDLNANNKITFYTIYGDYIARISVFVCVFLILYTVAAILLRGWNRGV